MTAQLPQRSAGVQLHPTSLPAGRLGDDALRFVDWLADAGQSWWQMLPLGPPDRARSPYKAASAFAAWRGLLADPAAPVCDDDIEAFRAAESFWIADWEAVAGGRRAVADQVRFAREWGALRAYAAERGVRLIGDVPIYVAPGSADHRAHPELFVGGEVAGVPPDALSETGQLWGNPLYDWPALQRRDYRWWTERLRRTFAMFDVTRIDHFRGFVAYWAVPADASDARGGRWRRGPGRAVFDAAARSLGELPVIAEDLGVITEPVDAAAPRARLSGHGRHAVRLRSRRPARPASPRAPRDRQRRLHRHARHEHAARLVGGPAGCDPRGGFGRDRERRRRTSASRGGR